MTDEIDQTQSALPAVFRLVLRPLIKFALARRIPIQAMIDLLKRLYVSVSAEEFSITGKRLTDSRISVLTGLQRKDIKAIRGSVDAEAADTVSAGPLPRLVAHWRGAPGYQDDNDNPLTLPKTGPAPSFETLVAMISHDIHPRTLLDDLVALGHAMVDDGNIALTAEAFVPQADEDALLGYLANNLGDHAQAAVANVLAAPATAPHFERAVHYNHLSADSLVELDALARRLHQQTLERINTHALALQIRDKSNPTAKGRFRCGSFVLCQGIRERETRKAD